MLAFAATEGHPDVAEIRRGGEECASEMRRVGAEWNKAIATYLRHLAFSPTRPHRASEHLLPLLRL